MAERRSLIAAVAAATVVTGAFLAILTFGELALPTFDALADHPDPSITGTVAFKRYDDEPCLYVVPASGGRERELVCGFQADGEVGWTDGGLVTVSAPWQSPSETVVVDPSSGAVLRREAGDDPGKRHGSAQRADGTRVTTRGHRGRAVIEVVAPGRDIRTLVAVDGPRDYAFWGAQWSPDGRWILARDSAGRLLVVDPGRGTARTLATDADQAAWHQPGA